MHERLSCPPLEQPHPAVFGDLRQSIDHAPVLPDLDQSGSGGQIAIPDIVPHELEMPHALAGFRIQSEQTIGEQVIAQAVRAVEIECSGTGWHKDQPGFRIERHPGP